MKVTQKDLEQAIVWMQLGTRIVQIAVGTFADMRKLLASAGISDDMMAAADAEYGRRIAQARAQQEDVT